eukprot:15028393-Alexandrium_andersonii.AAC.1
MAPPLARRSAASHLGGHSAPAGSVAQGGACGAAGCKAPPPGFGASCGGAALGGEARGRGLPTCPPPPLIAPGLG